MDYSRRKKTSRFCAVLALLFLSGMVGASVALAGWKPEWEKTLQTAKKEGQVTVYIYRYGPLLQAFEKEHPDIKVVSVTGPGSQLTARIMAERRAGKYIPDIFSGGANGNFNVLYKGRVLDPLKPTLILPEVVDESKWFEGGHRYVDPERQYIFAYLTNVSSGQLAYNTNLVNPKKFRSYYDLLNPKWKGKLVSLDPRHTGLGATMQFFYYNPELGPKFIRRLFGEMDATLSRDFRQMTDWLAVGKFPLCIGCTKIVEKAKRQGLPVDQLDSKNWKEGASISTGGGSLSLLNRAPHPNAAKIFVNWLLSRKGQIALQKFGDVSDPPNSRRIDIPKDDIPPQNRLVEGMKYFDVLRPEWQDMTPIFNLANEIVEGRESKGY